MKDTINKHKNGKFREAEKEYLSIIRNKPDDAQSNFWLGTLYIQLGRYDHALKHLNKSIKADPEQHEAYNNLGLVYLNLKDTESAISNFRNALEIKNDYLNARINLGITLFTNNNFSESEEELSYALFSAPDDYEVNYYLAKSFKEQQNYENAEEYFVKCTELNPNSYEPYFELGYLNELNNHDDEALSYYHKTLKLFPDLAEAYFNMGNILRKKELFDKAEISYSNAIRIDHNYYKAHLNLGVLYIRLMNFEEAVSCLKRALSIREDDIDAQINLGTCYFEMGKIDEALHVYERILVLDNKCEEAHLNKSIALLLKGNFKDGFKEFEWRSTRKVLGISNTVPFPLSVEKLSAKRVLIRAEQGLGDTIQFLRFIPLLKKYGAFTVFECGEKLKPLLVKSYLADEIITGKGNHPICDYEVSLLSLPFYLGLESEDIPDNIPYLHPDAQKVSYWKEKIKNTDKFKVGFIWKGNPAHQYDYKRSCDLKMFQELYTNPNIQFFSLQFETTGDEQSILRRNNIIEFNEDLENTAAIIMNLDLLISVDTSIAHLAGALGAQVWTLISFIPDWRWMLDKDYSPWYPNMKLFRQEKINEWDSVFSKAAVKLDEIIKRRTNESGSNIPLSYIMKKIRALELNHNSQDEEAEKFYHNLLEENPDDDEVNYWLGKLYYKQIKFKEACEFLGKVFESGNNKSADLFLSYGYALQKQQRIKESELVYLEGLKYNDSCVELHNNLSILYEENENWERAKSHLHRILFNNSSDYNSLQKLAGIHLKLGEFNQAVTYYEKACEIKKEDFYLLNQLGFSQQAAGNLKQAETTFLTALSKEKNNPGVHLNLGNNYFLSGKFEKAEEYYNKALQLDKTYSIARVSLGLLQLLRGNWTDGWKNFSYRDKFRSLPEKFQQIPEWGGEEISDKNLLVLSEQGLGDNIQFSRFLAKLKGKAQNIYFISPPKLLNLFNKEKLDNITFNSDFTPLDVKDLDYRVSLMELPKIFNTDLYSIPSGRDNISVNEQLVNSWNKTINITKGLKIGLVWRGNQTEVQNRRRHLGIEQVLPLLKKETYQFFILNNNLFIEEQEEIKKFSNVVFYGDQNLENIAAIIANLDLVITVDTFSAHLAGSLDVPVWNLLPFIPDWRWLLNRSDSPWYPGMKLFRQEIPGDWTAVISKVITQLEKEYPVLPVKFSSEEKLKTVLDDANKFLNEGDVDNAIKLFEKALLIDELNPETYFFLGYCYHHKNNFGKALEYYNKTVNLDESYFNAYNNIGLIFKELGKLNEAKKAFSISLKINEQNALVYNNLGIINDLQGDFAQAEENYQKALLINPGYAEAYLNLANVLQTKGLFDEALVSINKSIELSPHYVDAHFNKSLILLKEGLFEEGLIEYEWRLKKDDYYKRKFSKPALTLSPLEGKKVLITDEQGFGDTFNFSRYFYLLKEAGAEVIFECDRNVSELMTGCHGVDIVLERESLLEPELDYDYHLPLLSLPLYFGTSIDTIPNKVPYIEVKKDLLKYWREYLAEFPEFKVGIVWQGKTPLNNMHRATSYEYFSRLASIAGVKLFSLQKGEESLKAGEFMQQNEIIDLSEKLNTFEITAAIIKNLDLVISIDTSVAHLSGALGQSTWTLLSYKSDWRWFTRTSESPWYPTMRLYRQKDFGNWRGLFLEVADDLAKMIEN